MEQPHYTWPYGACYLEATQADDDNLRAIRRAAAGSRETVLREQKAAGKAKDVERARALKPVAAELLRWERAVNLFRAVLLAEGDQRAAGPWPPEMASELGRVNAALLYPDLAPAMVDYLQRCGGEWLP